VFNVQLCWTFRVVSVMFLKSGAINEEEH